MLQSIFIEDIFLEFYDFANNNCISINHADQSACHSFVNVINNNKHLTEAQGNYIIKILEKHKKVMAMAGFDYREILSNSPTWKNPFRIIDLSKKIYVEKNKDGRIVVCLKFPYQLKKEFETEIEKRGNFASDWDTERKIRILNLYETNLIQLYEFALKHNFEIDETLLIALGEVEEIWQNSEEILPGCELTANWVTLVNSSKDVDNWWNDHSTPNYHNSLLLAKSMGYPYTGKPYDIVEKIASVEHNHFWIKDYNNFFELTQYIEGKVVYVIDRASSPVETTKEYVNNLTANGVDKNNIRVCFRLDKNEDNGGFNQWVKDEGFGGNVDNAKFYIFNGKPGKWLFKDINSVKILVSNNVYPQTGPITRDWFNNHPCVVYLGNVKPTEMRNKKIVEL